MTGIDTVLAVAAVAVGVACLVAALRMTSGTGRLGLLLLVVLLAVLIGLGFQLPTWHQIVDYLAPTPMDTTGEHVPGRAPPTDSRAGGGAKCMTSC